MTTTSTGVSMDLDTKPAAMGDAVYGRLLKERIIWLGGPVTDESANQICAQMLLLAAEDPEKPIYLYINSPGGSVTAGMAIYDTMQFIRPEIQTVCLGQAASAAAVLLAAGTPGKRLALPNARVLIHQPAMGGGERGTATDLQIQADEVLRMRQWLADTLADLSNQSSEQVDKDIERDLFMTAAGAKEYGLIDEVVTSRKMTRS